MFSVLASVLYLLISFTLLCTGIGLNNTLLGVEATLAKFDTLTLGLMMSSYYIGFILGTRVVEGLLAKVGHIRCFASLAGMIAAVALLHSLWIDPVYWIALRCLHGACISSGYMVIESWLNGIAINRNRGRIMSVYMILNSLGLAAGQQFFHFSEAGGFALFAVTAILASVSVVPLLLSKTPQPATTLHPAQALGFRALFTLSPLSVIGALANGLVNGTLFGHTVPTLLQHGFSAAETSEFVAMTFIGGVILQWPLGSLSDRINRRTVVLLSSLGSMAMAGLIAFLITQPHPSYALMLLAAFFYGGFCYPIYTLLIALLNDRLEPSMFTRASRALLSLSGFGAIIGPLCGSLCLHSLGHSGGFAFIAFVFAVLAIICLQRMVFGKKLPRQRKLTG